MSPEAAIAARAICSITEFHLPGYRESFVSFRRTSDLKRYSRPPGGLPRPNPRDGRHRSVPDWDATRSLRNQRRAHDGPDDGFHGRHWLTIQLTFFRPGRVNRLCEPSLSGPPFLVFFAQDS